MNIDLWSGLLIGVAVTLTVVNITHLIIDVIAKAKEKKQLRKVQRAETVEGKFLPYDYIYITGGEHKGRYAHVTEAGTLQYKGKTLVSVTFTVPFDEWGLVDSEYCWSISRKGEYKPNGTNESELS